jgi:hypothetical protein
MDPGVSSHVLLLRWVQISARGIAAATARKEKRTDLL